jgi:hypothetical protein
MKGKKSYIKSQYNNKSRVFKYSTIVKLGLLTIGFIQFAFLNSIDFIFFVFINNFYKKLYQNGQKFSHLVEIFRFETVIYNLVVIFLTVIINNTKKIYIYCNKYKQKKIEVERFYLNFKNKNKNQFPAPSNN